MMSNGGVLGAGTAGRFPVRMVESGPAAGALAASHLAQRLALDRLLSFDMGGTTAKACLIENRRPTVTGRFEVDRAWRFKAGSGFPVLIPAIDMIEIGAGGGSIATVDGLGLMKVGPDSAGSEPGPACYGRGGAAPTVTDADLLLGLLDAGNFLGGEMALDTAAAERAMDGLAGRLGLSRIEAARGVFRVVGESMAAAARAHATDRGLDYRGLPVLAFGGAGPVHACFVAELLDGDTVIYPPLASVLSAYRNPDHPAPLRPRARHGGAGRLGPGRGGGRGDGGRGVGRDDRRRVRARRYAVQPRRRHALCRAAERGDGRVRRQPGRGARRGNAARGVRDGLRGGLRAPPLQPRGRGGRLAGQRARSRCRGRDRAHDRRRARWREGRAPGPCRKAGRGGAGLRPGRAFGGTEAGGSGHNRGARDDDLRHGRLAGRVSAKTAASSRGGTGEHGRGRARNPLVEPDRRGVRTGPGAPAHRLQPGGARGRRPRLRAARPRGQDDRPGRDRNAGGTSTRWPPRAPISSKPSRPKRPGRGRRAGDQRPVAVGRAFLRHHGADAGVPRGPRRSPFSARPSTTPISAATASAPAPGTFTRRGSGSPAPSSTRPGNAERAAARHHPPQRAHAGRGDGRPRGASVQRTGGAPRGCGSFATGTGSTT